MKERIAKFIAGLSLLAVFGCGIYQAVQPVSAQSGGGYPSNPNFQSVKINGPNGSALSASAAVTGTQQIVLTNTSTTDGDSARYIVASGSSQIQMGACNQNFVSLCKMIGGPSAASAYIETFGAIPLCMGTANTVHWCISATGIISTQNDPYFVVATGTPTINLSTTPADVTGVTGISVIAGKFYTYVIYAEIDTNAFATISSVNFAWVPTAGFLTNVGTMTGSDSNGGAGPPGTAIGSMSSTAIMEPNQALIIAPSNTANVRHVTITGLVTFDTTTTMRLQFAPAVATSHIRINNLKVILRQVS